MTASAAQPCVYVMENDYGVKIGISLDAEQRAKELSKASGMPVTIIRAWPMERAKTRIIEAWAHRDLAQYRRIGEWFHVHPIEACDTVAAIIKWDPPMAPISDITRERINRMREITAKWGRVA